MSNQVDSLQLQGERRQEVIEKSSGQLNRWHIAVPTVEPLVMDFGQGDFYTTGLIEYWIANEIEAGYCAKYLYLFDQQHCPTHSHAHKHETFHIVKGSVRLRVDNQEHILHEGDILSMPPGKVHTFSGQGNALILEISTPCLVEDNIFHDKAIAQWLDKALS